MKGDPIVAYLFGLRSGVTHIRGGDVVITCRYNATLNVAIPGSLQFRHLELRETIRFDQTIRFNRYDLLTRLPTERIQGISFLHRTAYC